MTAYLGGDEAIGQAQLFNTRDSSSAIDVAELWPVRCELSERRLYGGGRRRRIVVHEFGRCSLYRPVISRGGDQQHKLPRQPSGTLTNSTIQLAMDIANTLFRPEFPVQLQLRNERPACRAIAQGTGDQCATIKAAQRPLRT